MLHTLGEKSFQTVKGSYWHGKRAWSIRYNKAQCQPLLLAMGTVVESLLNGLSLVLGLVWLMTRHFQPRTKNTGSLCVK